MAVTYNTSGEGNTIGSNSKGVLYTTLTPEGPQINFMDHAGNLINTFDSEEAGRAFLDADTDFNRYNALQKVGTPAMATNPFASAPINDNTGKISNNKGGGGAPATTMALGEDGGTVNPPSSGGPDVKAVDPKGGGGAPPAAPVTPVEPAPTIMTQAFGEEGNPPAPVETLPVDLGTENIEGGPAVLPEFNPNVPSGLTRAIGEDGQFPGLADLIVTGDQLGPPQTGMTRAIGEDGQGPSLTDLIGKEPVVTTMAMGEEGPETPFPGGEIIQPPIVQPPGGTFATTQAVGEEDGDFAPIGGGMLTTQAMFEDGMPTPPAPPVANPYQPQPFNPRPPVGGGKGGGMQPQPQPQPVQPYQPQPFQPYQPQPFMPQPPMYGGGYGMPYGGSFGSPYGNPYGGGFGGGYGMQRPQPFGGSFYGNPYMPPPPPTPYGGGKGGGFGPQQTPQPFYGSTGDTPLTQPQIQPQPQPQPGGKGGGQASSGGGLGMLAGAGSLLGGQQNTGGSSNNASPFGGSSGGGSRTAMF